MLLSSPLVMNPLAQPLFNGTLVPVLLVLTTALAALIARVRGHIRQLPGDVLFVRWRTWALIAPAVMLAVLAGPFTTTLLAAAIALQACRELASLLGLSTPARVYSAGAAVFAPLAVLAVGPAGLPWILGVLLLGASGIAIVDASTTTLQQLLLVVLYGVMLPTLIVAIDLHPAGGAAVLLTVMLGVALSDVGAFVCGRRFGKHALAPSISPAKTWEGVLGNVAGALLGVAVFGPALPAALPPALLGLMIALGAVWGDLLESLIKRGAGVKDAGAWLPGFGGLLDRIDSLLIVVALVALLLGVL